MNNKILSLFISAIIIIINSQAICGKGLNEEMYDKKTYIQENFNSMDSMAFMLNLSTWALTKGVIINYELAPNDIENKKYEIGGMSGLEVLKYFCNKNKYIYRIHGNIVNVISKTLMNNRNYVMNMYIPSIRVNNEDRFQVFGRIVDELKRLYPNKVILDPALNYESETKITTTEIRTTDQEIVNKIRRPKMKISIRNATVREILNVISEKENAFWIGEFRDSTENMLVVIFSLENYFQNINRANENKREFIKYKYKDCKPSHKPKKECNKK